MRCLHSANLELRRQPERAMRCQPVPVATCSNRAVRIHHDASMLGKRIFMKCDDLSKGLAEVGRRGLWLGMLPKPLSGPHMRTSFSEPSCGCRTGNVFGSAGGRSGAAGRAGVPDICLRTRMQHGHPPG